MQQTAVKRLAEGRIGGYLIVWGDASQRDLHGEYFSKATELGLDWYPQRPVLYQHGLDDALKAELVGVIDNLRPDDTGLWAEAQLDLRSRYVRAVQRLVDQGLLNWSSGSLPHLVKVDADGHIRRWPLIEGSLTPTPAEPRRTNIQSIKQAYRALGLDTGPLLDADEPASPFTNPTETTIQAEGDSRMTQAARKYLPLLTDNAEAAPRIQVGSPYDQLEADDMLHGYMLMRATKHFNGVSDAYARALAHKVQGRGLSAMKADELAHTAQSGYGDEWVPELWSAQIWQKARQENVLLPLFRSIEMPSNPFELPIEGTDPEVFYVPETSSEAQLSLGSSNPIPDSKVGTGKIALTAKKLALRVGFSSELVEDSIVPVLNIYRQQAMRAITDSIDAVLLNGDSETGATGNINSDHAAPAATARYLAFNGLRRLPLVTQTTQRVDMGNIAPTLAKLREARFKMPMRYATRPTDLAWVVDGGTYARLLALPEFLTMDKAGPMATAMTGQIGFVDGIPVLLSAEMPLTEADGKVGASTNERGSALCVYHPGWFVGYRRRIAVNVDYLPYHDSYQLTATVRLAFAPFDTRVASMLYNIAV